MPDRDEVIRRISWFSRMDDAALAAVQPGVLEATVEKLAQPLANYLILCQVLEKDGLWEKSDDFNYYSKLSSSSQEYERIMALSEAALGVVGALEDIPHEARPPLLAHFIPQVEKEIVRQYPQYRYLVYETKQAVKGREETKKLEAKRSKTDNVVFWVLYFIFIGGALLLEFKFKMMFDLNTFSSRFAAASGWGRVWVAAGIPLAILGWTLILMPVLYFLTGLFRKTANLMEGVQYIDPEKYRPEEQNWVWLCQRCEHIEPFLGEDDLECPRCRNRMTKVRGQWGR